MGSVRKGLVTVVRVNPRASLTACAGACGRGVARTSHPAALLLQLWCLCIKKKVGDFSLKGVGYCS